MRLYIAMLLLTMDIDKGRKWKRKGAGVWLRRFLRELLDGRGPGWSISVVCSADCVATMA